MPWYKNKVSWLILGMLVIELIVIGFNTKKIILISGSSMEPTIRTNTIALVSKKSIEDIEKDDIICFTSNEETIVHRVIEITTNDKNEVQIKTKGDNNKSIDSAVVTNANYIGKIGIYVGLVDIFLELLPKIISAALVLIGVISLETRRKTKNEKA